MSDAASSPAASDAPFSSPSASSPTDVSSDLVRHLGHSPSSMTMMMMDRASSAVSMRSSLSDTGAFEVRYSDLTTPSGAPTPSPMAPSPFRSGPHQHQLSSQLTGGPQQSAHGWAPSTAFSAAVALSSPLDSSPSDAASASPAVMSSPSTTSPPHPRHAFLFDRAASNSSNAASSLSEINADGEATDRTLTSTARCTPTPSTNTASHRQPRSPRHSESPQQPHRRTQQRHQQQQDEDDDDPFQQIGAEAMQHQQQQLLRNSTSLSRTVVAPRPAAQEEKQQSRLSSTTSFSQTIPRPASDPNATAAALSSLPSHALAAKAAKIASLIEDFDAKFLEAGGSGPDGEAARARLVYPAWALPFVEEMAAKMEAVLRAQHRAEEQEEAERQAQQQQQWGSPRSSGSNSRRAQERLQEQQRAQARLARLSALRAQSPSSSAAGRGQSPPAGRFYPEDTYTVELNEQLPFLRDHGSFTARKSGVLDARSSPRRNLSGLGVEKGVPYQQQHQHHQQHASSLSQTYQPEYQRAPRSRSRERAAAGGPRPVSSTSARYLTGLLGHDVGASTLNRIFRSTERSPSPPPPAAGTRGAQRTGSPSTSKAKTFAKEPPGPTIPKAPRFERWTPASPLRQSGSGNGTGAKNADRARRERERELETQALRIQVEELMRELHLQRNRQNDDDSRTSTRTLNQSSSTSGLLPSSPAHKQQSQPSGGGGIDESALAQALIRIGEANRAKFLALVEQISSLQNAMQTQAERMDAWASSGSGGGPVRANNDQETEALRAEQASMQAELSRLQGELATSVGDKERLAAQVRDLRLMAEKSKFALMEKVALLKDSSSEGARSSSQDRALLRTYEQDLRASREAIQQLQEMVAREADHAKAFRDEKNSMAQRLDKMASLLRERDRADKAAAFVAGKKSLSPAERLKALMHEYMASFYRGQFLELQKRSSGASGGAAARIELELVHSEERHKRELVQAAREHAAAIQIVSTELQAKEEEQEELVGKLDDVAVSLAEAEEKRLKQEQDLLATESLALDLQRRLAAAESNAATSDAPFHQLMTASFKGDYLRARNDTRLLQIVYGVGDEEIRFSDYVQRIDHRNKYQKRILLLTSRHLLVLWADRGRPLRRAIPILDIAHVSLSRQSASTFVIHAGNTSKEYDYLLVSEKRAEIMYHLLSLTTTLSGGTRSLKYRYGERLYVRDRGHMHRDIQVAEEKLILGDATIRPHNLPHDEEMHRDDEARQL